MNSDLQLKLRFKGARQYLQGPDIFDALCEELAGCGFEALEKIDVVFHKIASTQLCGKIFLDQEVPEAAPNVVLRALCGGKALTVLLEESATPVTERVPYDEESLVAKTLLDAEQKRIALTEPFPEFSNTEKFIALNKSLLLRTFPEAKGKWLFARLQLAKPLRGRTFEKLEVRFQGHSNFRITRSALLGDGEALGSLYFSLLADA